MSEMQTLEDLQKKTLKEILLCTEIQYQIL